jgi:excinuclease UvrABC nuclease subunit
MAGKRFSPSRDFNESGIEKAPKGKPVVYRIRDSKGDNIYTGSAKRGRVTERLTEHLPGGQTPSRVPAPSR